MAAESKIKMWAELTGLGQDKNFSNSWTDSATPTSGTGPIYMSITTVATQIDLGTAAGNTVVRSVIIKASDGVYMCNPVASSNLTAACYISAGSSNLYTYSAGTVVPWVQAVSTAGNIEYWWYGV